MTILHKFINPDVNVGALIITASHRQRFAIREAHRLANEPYPNVVAWDKFIENIWQESKHTLAQNPDVYILSKLEQKELWESIINEWDENQNEVNRLINIESVAKLASKAYDTSILYRVKLTLDKEQNHPIEVEMMEKWADILRTRLAEMNAMLPSHQHAIVSKWIRDNAVGLPSITFYGFSYPDALQQSVFYHLCTNGHANITSLNPCEKNTFKCETFNGLTDEITACAEWAKQKYKDNPNQQIGIFIPDLVNYQSDVLRIFDNTLVRQSMYTPLENCDRPYRISLGTAITERPLIKTLIKLMFMNPGKKISFDEISALLRNPFIGGYKSEHIRRAKLEAVFRKEGSPNMNWNYINDQINLELLNGQTNHFFCKDFAERWNRFADFYDYYPKSNLTPSDIVSFVKEVYAIWGLGERANATVTDTEIEKMLFDADNGWLVDFANIRVSESLTLSRGLVKLNKLIKDISFQPASGASTITILSEYEASNLPFDAVWVMGLTDEVWPKSPNPNPFILKEKQIESDVPHSSFQQECDYAIAMTKAILTQAKEVIFSYPKVQDNREKSPSNIITELAKVKNVIDRDEPYLAYSNLMQSTSLREFVIDDFAPAFNVNDKASGGTSLLRDQAHCPFKGFINHRLSAKYLTEQQTGLSAALRGDVLHACLDKFWRRVKNQEALVNLIETDGLTAYLSKVVTQSLEYYRQRFPDIFTDAIADVEHDRLVPTLKTWMESFEQERHNFVNVVTEQKREIEINSIRLSVTVDHTDETVYSDDDVVVNIADNKSGTVTPSDWFDEERLMEPQVPLYAVIESDSGRKIGSVTFKSFKQGSMGNKGIASDNLLAIGIKPIPEEKLSGHIQTWKTQIHDIVDEFKSGLASVNPHKVEKSCTYCNNAPVCRLNEKADNKMMRENVIPVVNVGVEDVVIA
ncbi:PD-(D/E)XK nuclease family protein [Pseudoalteromonas sp. OFAV1]|uniref:PD-(D/E)XK nuclease family protein n=1 Tax=Pseudoalteromonas sp. OFAV1 TaxID=2908892 RepID=UPI001F2BBB22|nr:PD-(D/E)XK nuclease family protein [Pseudoalteromonas sp. OFAV1]MCF2902061.1 PD-(D/E)XK nuclease family protein [Pseudoalteromonas sp. OFAV1]